MTVLDLAQDRARILGPNKRLGAKVVFGDERGDCAFKLRHRSKGSSPNAFRSDFGEKPLDGIQPGRTRRGEMGVVTRPGREPSSHGGMLVSRVVIQDQMDIESRRDASIDMFEELKKFGVPMARKALLDDLSTQGIEGCEKGGRSVTNVVVRLPGRHARTKWKDRGSPLQGLHAAFLVDAQHDGIRRRVHVEAHDVAQFLSKQRVGTELEALNPMRLEVVRAQDVLDRRATDAVPFRELARTPVRRILRRRLHGSFRDLLCCLRTDQLRPTRTTSIRKDAFEASFLKAPTNLNDVLTRNLDTPRDLGIREPISRREDNARAKNRALRGRWPTRQFDQRAPHLRTHSEMRGRTVRHAISVAQTAPQCNAIKRSGH